MTQINYEELAPSHILKDCVKRFWKVTNPLADTQHYTILPDGYFDLIIVIKSSAVSEVLLTGIYTKELEVVIPAKTTFLGISFLPLATEFILQRSIAEILNQHIALSTDYWGINKIEFDDFKQWTSQISKKMLLLSKTKKNIDERKKELFTLLFQSKGLLTVKHISNHLFWESRQINRYFKSKLGLSLKIYSNILRCKASFDDLKKGNLFPKGNFADQAHFINEVKKYTGTTPKVLARNKNDRFLQFSTRIT